MALGLGQTTDPVALVPGDPTAVDQLARELAGYADVLTMAGSGLARIDTGDGWRGQAADAFRRVFDGQPGRWTQAGDAFREAASALSTYSTALTQAQSLAAQAIGLWQAGPAHHTEAGQILASARVNLDSAGNAAAGLVGRARDLAPPKPGFWSQAGSLLGRAGHELESLGADSVNGLQSLGNSIISHPGADAATVGGMLLATISAGGDAVGVVLDGSVIAAPAGAALNALSTAGVVTGVGMSAAGLGTIVSDALGPQRVSMMNADGGAGSGGEVPRSYSGSPGRIANETGYTQRQIKDAIHAVKNQPGWRGFGLSKNPDVIVDIGTGEVYPEQEDGSPSDDSIGNIYDYLPDEP